MYRKYTHVGEEFVQLRQQVIDNRKPRKLIVQHVTQLDGAGNVKLLSFEGSCKVLLFACMCLTPFETTALMVGAC
jgi:hypothetical protein